MCIHEASALLGYIQIIGVGSISTGQDHQKFVDAGADTAQITTTLLIEGSSI